MLGTWYGPVRSDFSDSRDPTSSVSRDPMMIFSDTRDPIFNSKAPNWISKTPLKNPVLLKSLTYPVAITTLLV